jgi:hypothetical protein
VLAEGGLDGGEEVLGDKAFVGSLVGPSGVDAEFVAGLEPEGDLFDGGVFKVGGEWGLTGGGCGAGEDVAAGVRRARERGRRRR